MKIFPLLFLSLLFTALSSGATNSTTNSTPASNGQAESAPNAVPASGQSDQPALVPPASSSPAPANLGKKSARSAATPSGASKTIATGTSVTSAPASTGGMATSFKLDTYIDLLATEINLSADQKKDVQSFYLADGTDLQKFLNDDTLSPLVQAQKACDLRDARNEKIEALLQGDNLRQRKFLTFEARYRVALIEMAANGGWIPAQSLAPAPSPTQLAPGDADKVPNAKGLSK